MTIPAGYEEQILADGLNFMRTITEAYGAEEGMKLWATIADSIDPDIKGKMFFAMLTGEYVDRIRISGYTNNHNYVGIIKAIRGATGLGLKEAKDLADLLKESGKPITFKITTPAKRAQYIKELREAGANV